MASSVVLPPPPCPLMCGSFRQCLETPEEYELRQAESLLGMAGGILPDQGETVIVNHWDSVGELFSVTRYEPEDVPIIPLHYHDLHRMRLERVPEVTVPSLPCNLQPLDLLQYTHPHVCHSESSESVRGSELVDIVSELSVPSIQESLVSDEKPKRKKSISKEKSDSEKSISREAAKGEKALSQKAAHGKESREIIGELKPKPKTSKVLKASIAHLPTSKRKISAATYTPKSTSPVSKKSSFTISRVPLNQQLSLTPRSASSVSSLKHPASSRAATAATHVQPQRRFTTNVKEKLSLTSPTKPKPKEAKTGSKAFSSKEKVVGLEKRPSHSPTMGGRGTTKAATTSSGTEKAKAKSTVVKKASTEQKQRKSFEKKRNPGKRGSPSDGEEDEKKREKKTDEDLEGDRAVSGSDEEEDGPLVTLPSIKRQVERGDVSDREVGEVRRKKTDAIELELLALEVQQQIREVKKQMEEESEEEDLIVQELQGIVGNSVFRKMKTLEDPKELLDVQVEEFED